MTTWENTDSINESESLIVTSDAAFERVNNDFKMEEEKDWWFLKQNTAWLVQEIPNISFVDVADTMLESKKTLYDRKNWNVVVWMSWKSIETQPQDIWIYSNIKTNIIHNWFWIASFNDYIAWSKYCFIEWANKEWYQINIKWIYEIAYSFCMYNIGASATWIWRHIVVYRWNNILFPHSQYYWSVWSGNVLWIKDYSASWKLYLELEIWDIVKLGAEVHDTNWDDVWWQFRQGEFSIQFQQYKMPD